jgi:biotin transport system substrate-specific component
MSALATLDRWRQLRYAAPAAALLGSWALAACSQFEIPMWPVPMTLQTYAVLVIGAAFGARLAGAAVGLYLLQGALGLPFFAGGAGGVAHLAGPTGGYLIGFLFGALAIGALADRGWNKSFPGLLAAMTIGHALVFALGLLQLQLFLGWPMALSTGLAPFIAGSVVKTLAAAATVWAGAHFIGRRQA